MQRIPVIVSNRRKTIESFHEALENPQIFTNADNVTASQCEATARSMEKRHAELPSVNQMNLLNIPLARESSSDLGRCSATKRKPATKTLTEMPLTDQSGEQQESTRLTKQTYALGQAPSVELPNINLNIEFHQKWFQELWKNIDQHTDSLASSSASTMATIDLTTDSSEDEERSRRSDVCSSESTSAESEARSSSSRRQSVDRDVRANNCDGPRHKDAKRSPRADNNDPRLRETTSSHRSSNALQARASKDKHDKRRVDINRRGGERSPPTTSSKANCDYVRRDVKRRHDYEKQNGKRSRDESSQHAKSRSRERSGSKSRTIDRDKASQKSRDLGSKLSAEKDSSKVRSIDRESRKDAIDETERSRDGSATSRSSSSSRSSLKDTSRKKDTSKVPSRKKVTWNARIATAKRPQIMEVSKTSSDRKNSFKHSDNERTSTRTKPPKDSIRKVSTDKSGANQPEDNTTKHKVPANEKKTSSGKLANSSQDNVSHRIMMNVSKAAAAVQGTEHSSTDNNQPSASSLKMQADSTTSSTPDKTQTGGEVTSQAASIKKGRIDSTQQELANRLTKFLQEYYDPSKKTTEKQVPKAAVATETNFRVTFNVDKPIVTNFQNVYNIDDDPCFSPTCSYSDDETSDSLAEHDDVKVKTTHVTPVEASRTSERRASDVAMQSNEAHQTQPHGLHQHEKPDIGQTRPDIGQTRPDVGQTRPDVGQTWPGVGQTRPGVGQTRPGVGQTRPDVGQTRPLSTEDQCTTNELTDRVPTAPVSGKPPTWRPVDPRLARHLNVEPKQNQPHPSHSNRAPTVVAATPIVEPRSQPESLFFWSKPSKISLPATAPPGDVQALACRQCLFDYKHMEPFDPRLTIPRYVAMFAAHRQCSLCHRPPREGDPKLIPLTPSAFLSKPARSRYDGHDADDHVSAETRSAKAAELSARRASSKTSRRVSQDISSTSTINPAKAFVDIDAIAQSDSSVRQTTPASAPIITDSVDSSSAAHLEVTSFDKDVAATTADPATNEAAAVLSELVSSTDEAGQAFESQPSDITRSSSPVNCTAGEQTNSTLAGSVNPPLSSSTTALSDVSKTRPTSNVVPTSEVCVSPTFTAKSNKVKSAVHVARPSKVRNDHRVARDKTNEEEGNSETTARSDEAHLSSELLPANVQEQVGRFLNRIATPQQTPTEQTWSKCSDNSSDAKKDSNPFTSESSAAAKAKAFPGLLDLFRSKNDRQAPEQQPSSVPPASRHSDRDGPQSKGDSRGGAIASSLPSGHTEAATSLWTRLEVRLSKDAIAVHDVTPPASGESRDVISSEPSKARDAVTTNPSEAHDVISPDLVELDEIISGGNDSNEEIPGRSLFSPEHDHVSDDDPCASECVGEPPSPVAAVETRTDADVPIPVTDPEQQTSSEQTPGITSPTRRKVLPTVQHTPPPASRSIASSTASGSSLYFGSPSNLVIVEESDSEATSETRPKQPPDGSIVPIRAAPAGTSRAPSPGAENTGDSSPKVSLSNNRSDVYGRCASVSSLSSPVHPHATPMDVDIANGTNAGNTSSHSGGRESNLDSLPDSSSHDLNNPSWLHDVLPTLTRPRRKRRRSDFHKEQDPPIVRNLFADNFLDSTTDTGHHDDQSQLSTKTFPFKKRRFSSLEATTSDCSADAQIVPSTSDNTVGDDDRSSTNFYSQASPTSMNAQDGNDMSTATCNLPVVSSTGQDLLSDSANGMRPPPATDQSTDLESSAPPAHNDSVLNLEIVKPTDPLRVNAGDKHVTDQTRHFMDILPSSSSDVCDDPCPSSDCTAIRDETDQSLANEEANDSVTSTVSPAVDDDFDSDIELAGLTTSAHIDDSLSSDVTSDPDLSCVSAPKEDCFMSGGRLYYWPFSSPTLAELEAMPDSEDEDADDRTGLKPSVCLTRLIDDGFVPRCFVERSPEHQCCSCCTTHCCSSPWISLAQLCNQRTIREAAPNMILSEPNTIRATAFHTSECIHN